MKIAISGYGKMGHMIESILVERGIEYVASEDITSFNPGEAKQYVCIDFTTPDAFRANYRFLADNFKAVVVGTTGWNDIKDEVIAYFENAGTPMIHASKLLARRERDVCTCRQGLVAAQRCRLRHLHRGNAPLPQT